MEGRKNGENDKKIRRVVRLTLHNTGLHITFSSPFTHRADFTQSGNASPYDRICSNIQYTSQTKWAPVSESVQICGM